MTSLEEIAFTNLQFLNDRDDFLANRYKIDKNRFVKEDDDTVYTLDDLEYPLFFTFHQLMNHVHSSYEPRFHGKTKKELLDMFEIALDTLNEYYVETDNSNKRFEVFIDDIDDKIMFIIQYYKYGWCHRFPTIVKDYFTSFCRTLLVLSKDIHKFHYDEFIKPNLLSDDEDDTEDDNDSCDSNDKVETDKDVSKEDDVSTDEETVINEDDTKDKEV